MEVLVPVGMEIRRVGRWFVHTTGMSVWGAMKAQRVFGETVIK